MHAIDRLWNGSFRFTWLGPGRLPAALDLRRHGWLLEPPRLPCPDCIGLIDTTLLDGMHTLASFPANARRFIMVTGVAEADERAALILVGFGDVLGCDFQRDELEARARRTAILAHWLPRERDFGTLRLNLPAREAYARDKPLNLNPREFALLWRLADSPCERVSKQALIHDVWRMGFVPATNSVAVHISRLRRKLGYAGLDGIITTARHGGYILRLGQEEPAPAARPARVIADATTPEDRRVY